VSEVVFETEILFTKALLAELPLDRLIELGVVHDPGGKKALRVIGRQLISEGALTQKWRFRGIGDRDDTTESVPTDDEWEDDDP